MTLTNTTTALDTKHIIALDGYLEPFLPAISARYDVFAKWKADIIATEGGYEAFSKGYLNFGFIVDKDGGIVYREWAPNATEAYLTGDFSEFGYRASHSWNKTDEDDV